MKKFKQISPLLPRNPSRVIRQKRDTKSGAAISHARDPFSPLFGGININECALSLILLPVQIFCSSLVQAKSAKLWSSRGNKN